MTEVEAVVLAAAVGAASGIGGALMGAIVHLRIVAKQVADRRMQWAQERRFDIYKESLLLLMSLPHLLEEAVTGGEPAARSELLGQVREMRAGLSVMGGRSVREANIRCYEAFQEYVRLSDERGSRNVELPMDQRQSAFDIHSATYKETMEKPIQELGASMRQELGVED